MGAPSELQGSLSLNFTKGKAAELFSTHREMCFFRHSRRGFCYRLKKQRFFFLLIFKNKDANVLVSNKAIYIGGILWESKN
jgi:hypothetical protein